MKSLSKEQIDNIVKQINVLLRKKGIEGYRWLLYDNKFVLKIED